MSSLSYRRSQIVLNLHQGIVMSGWRPLIKGYFAALRLIVSAVWPVDAGLGTSLAVSTVNSIRLAFSREWGDASRPWDRRDRRADRPASPA
jgi:hypothetical protein